MLNAPVYQDKSKEMGIHELFDERELKKQSKLKETSNYSTP